MLFRRGDVHLTQDRQPQFGHRHRHRHRHRHHNSVTVGHSLTRKTNQRENQRVQQSEIKEKERNEKKNDCDRKRVTTRTTLQKGCRLLLSSFQVFLVVVLSSMHCGPEQPRGQTAILGHSLVHLLIRSHCSLTSLTHFAHSLCSLKSSWNSE